MGEEKKQVREEEGEREEEEESDGARKVVRGKVAEDVELEEADDMLVKLAKLAKLAIDFDADANHKQEMIQMNS